jgi:hypothetical protein
VRPTPSPKTLEAFPFLTIGWRQALWHARQVDHCRILDKFTSGLIFLGTPHWGHRDDESRWRALFLSLKSKWPPPNPDDLDLLATISSQFEEIDSHFPILSAYESMETKSQDRGIFKPKSTMVSSFCLFK